MEVKWTSYKINHSKVSNSVELSTIEIRICHLYLVVAKHFHHPEEAPFLLTSCSLFLPPLSPSRPQICILSLRIYLLGVFHVGRSIQYVIFFMWLLSLSIMFFRFIYFVTFISTSFLFIPEYYFTVCMYYNLFIYSSVDGHWGYFCLLAL